MDADGIIAIVILGLIVLCPVFLVLYVRSVRKRKAIEKRFSGVVDADAEASRVDQARDDAVKELEKLRADYAEKKKVFDRLSEQVAIFDERIAFSEFGVYEPHFDFDTSDQFRSAILAIRSEQKALVSSKNAAVCQKNWTVDGSASKGRTMIDRAIRLTLRAFNSECDAAISNVRWNNAKAMEKRIITAKTQIDRANSSNDVVITDEYAWAKIKELRLTHEYREKLKAEREERAELARAAREEQRLQRDLEEAEQAEARYQAMLDKAKADAAGAVGEKLVALTEKIGDLEKDLAEAHSKVERAQAMAELTRSGYVYIVSNIGSFGPDFVKIGLTRRLDPADRIRELGGASVPFLFDVHAVIYSDDAPALERALHAEFNSGRVNAINHRKEFFRVTLEDVRAAVEKLAPDATFFDDIEAQEYHETLALRSASLADAQSKQENEFPDNI
ncbi:MAG: DUF4041 domain-containing protein [Paracoccus sp. (in: a-proteobacteria)]|nr:DUF4041 domain-containing protein [Paracoccus sp. (in: a-proteobacteria)]